MFKATSDQLATGVLFVVIGFLACLAPVQSDTWWLLRAGRDIWQSGTIPLSDTYSYTAYGLFWPNEEWLSEWLMYGLYWVGGLPLLTAVCAAVIVSTWVLAWRLSEGPFELRFLLFGGCLVTSAGSWGIRPQLFSMGLFLLTCDLLLAERYRWLPLLFLVWTNLHAAVALGLVAVFVAIAVRTIVRRRLPLSAAVSALGCVGATFISPLRAGLWSFIPASIERSRTNQLIEWQPPGLSTPLWPFWAVAVSLPVAAVVYRRSQTERHLVLLATAVAMLPLAVHSVRNVAVFLLIGVPALSAVLTAQNTPPPILAAAREHERLNAVLLLASALAGLVLVAAAWRAPAARLGWQPIRPEAVDVIARCREPIYNTYADGGVLIWFVPSKPVFIDSRQDQYPNEFLESNRTAEFTGNFHALFDKHRVNCAVVRPGSPIALGLTRDPGWRLAYSDGEKWSVFDNRRAD